MLPVESSSQIVRPAKSISGILHLPGDKSISHRYGMLAALAEGESKIANFSTGADCQSTLACMEALGAKVRRADGVISIRGAKVRQPGAAGPHRLWHGRPRLCAGLASDPSYLT